MMVYPSSAHLLSNNGKASSGTLEIVPAETALTVFIFGPRRIVPVRITEFSITEEAFDPNLNPIRAKVSLGMTVLTVDDLGFDQKGRRAVPGLLAGQGTIRRPKQARNSRHTWDRRDLMTEQIKRYRLC